MNDHNLRIALVGYGKMGIAVEAEAVKRNHTISFIVDLENGSTWEQIHRSNTDVLIEFTHHDSFESNLKKSVSRGIPMVTGTTGWYDRKSGIEQWVQEHQGSLLYASNFSVGVNILFQLNKRLAELMDRHPEYDCFIEEQHHRYKQDAPSGTAIYLGNQIIDRLSRKSQISDESLRGRAPKGDELSIGFIRGGEIFGKHTVTYQSEIDTIEIRHQAHSRRGFALGAVIAAEWLHGKKGVFEFSALFT